MNGILDNPSMAKRRLRLQSNYGAISEKEEDMNFDSEQVPCTRALPMVLSNVIDFGTNDAQHQTGIPFGLLSLSVPHTYTQHSTIESLQTQLGKSNGDHWVMIPSDYARLAFDKLEHLFNHISVSSCHLLEISETTLFKSWTTRPRSSTSTSDELTTALIVSGKSLHHSWSRTRRSAAGILTIYSGCNWINLAIDYLTTNRQEDKTWNFEHVTTSILCAHGTKVLPHVGEVLELELDAAEGFAARARTPAECRAVAAKVWTIRRGLTRLRADARTVAKFLATRQGIADEARKIVLMIDDRVWEWRELAHSVLECVLAIQNNRMQETMQTLAVVTTMFVPLTFLAGIEGMNFVNQPELRGKWSYYGFWIIVVVLVGAQLAFFKRKGWI